MRVFVGLTDDTANWSFAKSETNLTGGFGGGANANRYTATAMSADVGYADITASRVGYSSITKRFTVTKSKTGATGAQGPQGPSGAAGTRGSKQFYRTIAGSSWSDSEAEAAITAAGLTKVLLDQVTLSNGSSFAETRFWDGAVWATITQVINGNLLVNGTVGATKIAVTNLAAISADLGAVTAGSLQIGSGAQQSQVANGELRVGASNGFRTYATGTVATVQSEWTTGNNSKIRISAYNTSIPAVIEAIDNSGVLRASISSSGGSYFSSSINAAGGITVGGGAASVTATYPNHCYLRAGSGAAYGWFVSSGTGAWCCDADYSIKNLSGNGRTVSLWADPNFISFDWTASGLALYVDGSFQGYVQTA